MQNDIQKILEQLKAGEIDVFSAMAEVAGGNGIENLDFARLDHARSERCGFPEFVYGAGKTLEQLLSIIPALLKKKTPVLVTRVVEEIGAELQKKFPEGQFDKLAKAFVIRPEEPLATKGNVLILTAGTSDLGIAMEAKYTLELCGCGVELVSDIGVAGLHRLFAEVSRLRKADALIVVAGMEGALPSVVGGLVRCPVIAVPTSVGYGAALNGITALLGMLNSCASGVTVVNIDNGFGAGCAAARIVNK
jgi:NCAIR mutase (PurE)-related protein